ncbi:MAG: thioredoxin-dependent thiol peroxidase [Eubacteriales bacterium]|nr:thioredoxin-dependent thiol peroxidase [Eubacteriales bacterium]
MAYLEVGSKAPDFTLQNQDGENISLHDFLGKNVILYFYPKDNTSGCTREAQGFAEVADSLANTVVIGISADSVQSHKGFACKYNLSFHLLSDPDHMVLEPYGIWQLKKNYGKEYMGIVRTTYVINAQGNIAKVWKVAKVDGHVEAVCKFIENM